MSGVGSWTGRWSLVDLEKKVYGCGWLRWSLEERDSDWRARVSMAANGSGGCRLVVVWPDFPCIVFFAALHRGSLKALDRFSDELPHLSRFFPFPCSLPLLLCFSFAVLSKELSPYPPLFFFFLLPLTLLFLPSTLAAVLLLSIYIQLPTLKP